MTERCVRFCQLVSGGGIRSLFAMKEIRPSRRALTDVFSRAQAEDYNSAKRCVDRVESINASHEKAGRSQVVLAMALNRPFRSSYVGTRS